LQTFKDIGISNEEREETTWPKTILTSIKGHFSSLERFMGGRTRHKEFICIIMAGIL